MKLARLRIDAVDPLSPVHAALVDATGIDRVLLRSGGASATGPRSYVLSVSGDVDAVAAALDGREGIHEYEVVRADGDGGHVYVHADSSEVVLALHATLTRGSLVSPPPVEFYPDGRVVFRVLGDPADLEAAITDVGDRLPVTVERLADYDRPPERAAAALTDRQQEVVRAALDCGYYDRPREATHEDVADAVGCAPATAGEHLRKAEAALVRAVFATGE